MELLKYIIRFLIGLGIVLSCTILSYYVGLMIVGSVVTSGLPMVLDMLGRWILGLIINILVGFILVGCYKLGELIID